MLKLAGSLNRYPARVTSIGFAILVILGTLFLLMPGVTAPSAKPLSALDALFMATSSVCITGLAVRPIGTDFSFLGQLLLLVLVQIGGLGIMTLTTIVLLASGVRGGLRHHLVITSTVTGDTRSDLRVLLRVIGFTMTCEAIVRLLLFIRFLFRDMSLGNALWHSIYLSVCGFCNAGFALDAQSLMPYHNDAWVLLVLALLIIVGGLGYPVIFDIASVVVKKRSNWWHDLHLHSKLMLIGSLVLTLGGFVFILVLEWDNPKFENTPLLGQMLTAFFQSVTCRTAGYNSVNIADFGNATLVVMMILMMIGAGPCSTAGGIKVTTVCMLVLHAIARFRSHAHVTVFRRTIPPVAIERAIATALLFAVLFVAGIVSVLALEEIGHSGESQRREALNITFEVVSALGTTGLSIGDTSKLLPASQLVFVVLMFVGRLGPIMFFSALSSSPNKAVLKYASEEPITG